MEMMIRNGIILMEITNSVISGAAAAIRDPGFFHQLPRAKAFNNTTDEEWGWRRGECEDGDENGDEENGIEWIILPTPKGKSFQ